MAAASASAADLRTPQQSYLRSSDTGDFVVSQEARQFLAKGGIIIRMRGLPYECTPKQVIDFFRDDDASCSVCDGEDGILFVKKPDGRSTGDAFVQFAEESEAAAALSKHKELIGTRYIELFRSTPAEVEQVLRKSHESKPRAPVQVPLIHPTTVPQHVIMSGTKKDCIRLRGLPYEAQVEHILEFLGDNANNIATQGVHMVYNVHGQPSGEAFIQMKSEAFASQAATHCHHRFMTFGKKQRYVEAFQCSGEDMNKFLYGGHVAPKATSVMSPGIDSMGLPLAPALLPYCDPSVTALMPLVHTNPFFINPLALQQPQQQPQPAHSLPASFKAAPAKPPVYPMYPSWPGEVDPYKSAAAAAVAAAAVATTDPIVKPKTSAESDVLQTAAVATTPQPELYAPYPTQPGVFFLHPNLQRVLQTPPVYPKPAGYPSVLFPQVPPQHVPSPMGMLGVKRSWEQAFPLETAAVQGAKRWPAPQVAGFATPPGFFPDVG